MNSARGQLLLTPNDAFKARLSFDYIDSDNIGYTWENVADGPTGDTKPYTYSGDVVPLEEHEGEGISLSMDYEFENGYTLTSISAYRSDETRWLEDEDGSPLDFLNFDAQDKQENLSQELRLASPTDSNFDYILGLYYFDQEGTYDFRLPFGVDVGLVGDQLVNGSVDTTSYAVFAHANYRITDPLNIFAGVRYTDEDKDLDGVNIYVPTGFLFAPDSSVSGEIGSSEISWDIGVQYDIGENIMSYASVSEGFKSGGFDLFTGEKVDPEFLTAYEIGFKSTLSDGQIILNGSIFFNDYQDLQVRSLDAVTLVSRLQNAANVETKGAELELVARPVEGLTFNVGLGYVDSEYTDFENANDVFGATIDASGNSLPLAPEWTFNAGFDYEYILDNGGVIITQADYSYLDERYSVLDAGQNGEDFILDSIGTLNARIGYRNPGDSWELFLWSKNLTDEDKAIDRRRAAGLLFEFETYTEPQTYGATLKMNF